MARNDSYFLNLIRVISLQKSEQHAQPGMVPQPLANLLDAFVIFLAKLFHLDRFEVILRFHGMESVLPGAREEIVQVVMQVAVN